MKEKNILCFGDSNTWGADPACGPRFDRVTRWPCILQKELGEGFHVVEEGLCGRTTVWDDPIEGDKNGLKQLVPILKSHVPLDVLIIMLGTNDLKNRFSVSPLDVANSVNQLVETARNTFNCFDGTPPEILVICPPPFAPLAETPFKEMFIGGEEKSHRLATEFREVAADRGFRILNAGEVIQSSPIDGIHFEPAEHAKLGKAVAEEIRNIL